MQIEVSKVYIPSTVYRGITEKQLKACFSLEEAKELIISQAKEIRDVTPEKMRAIMEEGPKECAYEFTHPEGELHFYPDGNGNWPIIIREVELKQKVVINV